MKWQWIENTPQCLFLFSPEFIQEQNYIMYSILEKRKQLDPCLVQRNMEINSFRYEGVLYVYLFISDVNNGQHL